MKDYIVHLTNEATNWENASPLGNGYAGLMVFGYVGIDRLVFNEESIWSSVDTDTNTGDFYDKIQHMRQMFREGREFECDQWAEENMKNNFFGVKPFEYAGDLLAYFSDRSPCDEDYVRDLDIVNGILNISYTQSGVKYKREHFASYKSKLIACKYTADHKFGVTLKYRRSNGASINYTDSRITAEATTTFGDHKFVFMTDVVTDGSKTATDEGIAVTGATYVEFYTAIATAFKYGDEMYSAAESMLKCAEVGWDALKSEHIDDFSSLMKRSDIDIETADPEVDEMSTYLRIKRLIRSSEYHDYSLMSLYWQFGKYLLISSSRPGTLPANLQGVWADGLCPPWNSDYHTNINLQMNYWQAEQANITECIEPLFDYMNNYLLPGGQKVALENYHARGMVVHHLSDIYGFAAVADGLCGVWPMGGAWLAYHMWEHYLYTMDEDFLRNVAYKYIKENVLFFMDYIYEGDDGLLQTGPSMSPENSYFKTIDGEQRKLCLCESPTMDIQIISGLFDLYIQCEGVLKIDTALSDKAAEIITRLPRMQIGKYGQLMEWKEDYEEFEPGHRHISHAFGLYPASQITRHTPELFNAIEVTLDRRLSHGGGHTGWSRAWLINLFARLGNKEKTYSNIRDLFAASTLYNLFDKHPPFQIDGNFGGAAGITEMLMQSHEHYISIIPATPDFINGSFTGLRARGGVTVSASWRQGIVEHVELTPDKPMTIRLKVPGREVMDIYTEGTVTVDFKSVYGG